MNGGTKVKKDYVILNIEKEYPGYTGTEKWMIITDLTEEQFSKQYPKEYKRWKKAVIVSSAIGDEIIRFKNNEKKNYTRDRVKHVDIDDEEVLEVEDMSAVASFTRVWIRDALSTLPEVQRRRIYMFYVLGMTVDDIVKREKASRASVRQSLERGIASLQRYCEVSPTEKRPSLYKGNDGQKGSRFDA